MNFVGNNFSMKFEIVKDFSCLKSKIRYFSSPLLFLSGVLLIELVKSCSREILACRIFDKVLASTDSPCRHFNETPQVHLLS